MAHAHERFPGESKEAHPEVFCTLPTQPTEKKDGQLTADQVKHFFREGYVLVKDYFKHEELEPSKDALREMVEEVAQRLYKAGKITELYAEYNLFRRLIMINNEFPGANVLFMKWATLKQPIKDLWSGKRLLNAVEQLIGPDIAGHPVLNFRSKVPHDENTTVPWHQDSGYLHTDSYKVLQVTAWIPFMDATKTNGCMQFIRGGHRSGRIAKHECCAGNTWYVMLDPREMEKTLDVNVEEDTVTVEVPFGSMVLFNNLMPHRSLDNLSQDIRWSIDLRWQRPDQPYGFYGLKEGVLMRSSKNPNLTIDWESFEMDRFAKQQDAADTKESGEFDTVMSGPWMKQWEIVNHNEHTAQIQVQG